MRETVNWAGYYEYAGARNTISLGDQRSAYEGALMTLWRNNPDVLNALARHGKPTLLLGGFNPNTDTRETFVEMSRAITGPDVYSRLIFLDMNSEPMQRLVVEERKTGVQAALENLPFGDGSIDFMFLDRTLNLMSDEQVAQFSQEASKALSKDGLILATVNHGSWINAWRNRMDSKRMSVECHRRLRTTLLRLTEPSLKLVLASEVEHDGGACEDYSLLAFSRKGSQFPEHRGEDIFYKSSSYHHN